MTIDYRIRPAKHVVRKLLAEAFVRLDRLNPLGSYRYVGFGGLFFEDFILFHRLFGFEEMTSIERDRGQDTRYEKNRPFKSVALKFGRSEDVLPTLTWDKPAIIWLDGVQRVNDSSLRDLAYLAENVQPLSAIVVTFNVMASLRALRDLPLEPISVPPDPEGLQIEGDLDALDEESLADIVDDPPTRPSGPLETLTREVGTERVPLALTDKNLRTEWGYADASRLIADAEIHSTLARRSAGDSDRLDAVFFADVRYQDDAKMLVVGWLVFRESQRKLIEQCRIPSLPTLTADGSKVVQVPMLTFREHKMLDALLPNRNGRVRDIAKSVGITTDEIAAYEEIYRYYPAFSLIDTF